MTPMDYRNSEIPLGQAPPIGDGDHKVIAMVAAAMRPRAGSRSGNPHRSR
jgi:hypothetical protein